MKTFACICGNRLFFDNTSCLACKRQVGWCPRCAAIRALEADTDGQLHCTGEDCGAALIPCRNYAVEGVCNRMVVAGPGVPASPLCSGCRFNRTIPDTSVPGNRTKWAQLESAKRRLLYTLDDLGLPYGTADEGFDPPLCFDFKADLVREKGAWHRLGAVEHVYTGHAAGRITINLDEADDAERERRRINMNEAHRTLIGHFRHEIAHYYWELLVRGRCEDACRACFGDHDDPPYGEALKAHYNSGPPDDWPSRYVSAYATMHPWEDFAETFAVYLDMAAVLDTVGHWGLETTVRPLDDFDQALSTYRHIGIGLNEINREMGLLDVVPEVFVAPVVEKLRFVHELIRAASRNAGGATDPREARA